MPEGAVRNGGLVALYKPRLSGRFELQTETAALYLNHDDLRALYLGLEALLMAVGEAPDWQHSEFGVDLRPEQRTNGHP
jgi:hypothetical protein